MTADPIALNITPESGAIHLNADDMRQLSDIGFWRSTQTKPQLQFLSWTPAVRDMYLQRR